MADGGAPVTPISKAGVPFPAGTEADPINVAGGTAGGPATIADGADVTQGAIADAAVAAGAAGTSSAKLRRLTTDISAMLTKLADPATQATLAAVLAKLSSDPATQTTLAAVLAKLSADPATQTTSAAILAKIIASPATEATLGTISTNIAALANDTEYEAVAASATNQALGATGATGDYLSHVTVFPATISPGEVTIKDDTTTIASFAGGVSSLSNIEPFTIVLGGNSRNGAWKITTGLNVSLVAFGNFT